MWNKYVSNYFDGNVFLFIEVNFLRLVCLEIYRRVYNSAIIVESLYLNLDLVSINKMTFNILEKHDCFIFFFEI